MDRIVERRGIPVVYPYRRRSDRTVCARRLEGKEAYVAGWRDFAAAAKIQSWSERDHHVQIFASGKCAVATYLFTIRFETGGQVQAIEGRDMFFLVKEKGRWLVVADQFSSEPVTG